MHNQNSCVVTMAVYASTCNTGIFKFNFFYLVLLQILVHVEAMLVAKIINTGGCQK